MTTEVIGLTKVLEDLTRLPTATKAATTTAGRTAVELIAAAVNAAASSARAPQTRRFRGAAHGGRDGLVDVVTLEPGRSGFWNDAAVLNATEYGSALECFHAPPSSSGYWIGPTVRRSTPPVVELYRRAVHVAVTADTIV